jgi:murein DD-endopeptidase MepM/ murein hydrolase activator NlpD
MRTPLTISIALVALVVTEAWPAASQEAELHVDVTHRARSIQPGEVVRVTATFSRPVSAVRAAVFDRTVAFQPTGDRRTWEGLVGIDLDVDVHAHALSIAGTAPDGAMARAQYPLAIVSKAFATRRLTVAPEYVTPPDDVVERIQREAARTTELFNTPTPVAHWRGGFLRPVPGEATSAFGRRSVFNGQARSPHSGADFRAGEGTPVQAPNSGTVVLAEDLYFSGNCVIIDHGLGLYSFFAHLSRIGVAEGDRIDPGDIIGDVGATGRVTGPHLHWTVRLNTARVDPLSLMAVLSDGDR